jgi:hypothetical protein
MKRNTKQASSNNSVGLTSSNVIEKYGKFGFKSQSKILARPSSVILEFATSDWDHGIRLTVGHSSEGGRIMLNGHDWTNQSVDEISEKVLQFLPRTIAEKDWNFDPAVDQDLIPIRWMISKADFGYPFHGQVKSGDELKKVIVAFLDDATSQVQPFEFESLSSLASKETKKFDVGYENILRLEIPIDEMSITPINNDDGSSSGTFVQTALVQRCWGVASRINTPDKVIWLSSSLQNIAWLFSKDINVLRAIAD